jgi:hypothetical protein
LCGIHIRALAEERAQCILVFFLRGVSGISAGAESIRHKTNVQN